jgi:hypothetical protein
VSRFFYKFLMGNFTRIPQPKRKALAATTKANCIATDSYRIKPENFKKREIIQSEYSANKKHKTSKIPKRDSIVKHDSILTKRDSILTKRDSILSNTKRDSILSNTCVQKDDFIQKKLVIKPKRVFVDPLLTEYSTDIFQYLYDLQFESEINIKQAEINQANYKILCLWLYQFVTCFKLKPLTFHLSIRLLNRVLSSRFVALKKFSLLGLVSLFIACKFEEINVPSVRDFVLFVEPCSVEEFVLAERVVLSTVAYKVLNHLLL